MKNDFSTFDVDEFSNLFTELKSSNEFLLSLINTLPFPLFVKDRNHRIVLMNDEFCHLFGYDRALIIGTTEYDYLPNDLAQLFYERNEERFATETSRVYYEETLDLNGVLRIFNTHATLFKDKNDSQYLIFIAHDITSEIEQKRKCKESEEKYRNLFEYTPIPLWVRDYSEAIDFLKSRQDISSTNIERLLQDDADLLATCIIKIKFVDVNQAALDLLLVNTKEELSENIDKHWTDESVKSFRKTIVSAYLGNFSFEGEIEAVNANGKKINLKLFSIVQQNTEVPFSTVIMTALDITYEKQTKEALEALVNNRTKELRIINQELLDEIEARKKIEKALSNEERSYHTLAESSPTGIFRADARGHCIYINCRCCQIIGITAEMALLDKWLLSIHSDDRQKVIEAWEDTVKFNNAFKLECRFCRSDGTIVRTFCNAVPEYDDNKAVKGFVGTITDITKHYQVEEKMRIQRQQLERIDRLNTMGEMSSSLAHQLNQPLAIISSYSQACLEHINDVRDNFPKLISVLEKISLHANRAGEIIHQIQNLFTSRRLNKTVQNINRLITSTISLIEDEYLEKINVIYDFNDGDKELYLDKTQIEQVISNLFRNAIDAIKSSCHENVSITIKTDIFNNELKVCFIDTGTGIAKSLQSDIFQPFFTTKSDSMGMGLSICRSIIGAHDGRFTLFSQEGVGTKICFSLPLNN